MRIPASRSFYTGVFLVSGVLMALQVIQARIFSVTTWYHISFLVISIAMFGLTLGALHVHRGSEPQQRAACNALMAEAAWKCGLFMVLALAGQMFVPIVSASVASTLATLPLMSLLIVPPYYFAGIVLSLAITRSPHPTARVYGIDLFGAAAGCLFALALMKEIDAPSAILTLSVICMAATRCFSKDGGQQKRNAIIMAVCLVTAANIALPRPLIYPLYIKSRIVTGNQLDYDHWNSISRVTISKERNNFPPVLWGPSPRLPPAMKSSYRLLTIDGDADTPINHFSGDCAGELKYLDYDVTTIAYALPALKSAAIIGVGGGRDVLSACHAGIGHITALDVNDIQISALTKIEPFKSYADIDGMPGLTLINSEARSWLSREKQSFDIIQMSLVDTWAATVAGAFALSENGLYTVEAWKTYLDHLNPGGVVTVSRWYIEDARSEMEKLISLAAAALLEDNIKDIRQHLFIVTSGHIATLVMSRDDLTKTQLNALERRAAEMSYTVLVSPRLQTLPANIDAILKAESRRDLEHLAPDGLYDITPSTDLHPFFFNQVRLTKPLDVVKMAYSGLHSQAITRPVRAALNLYVILLFSLLMVTLTIVIPLRRDMERRHKAHVTLCSLWFLLIGFGFMLLEISALQRMSVYLGHPSYSLGIVLFSFVLATGLGSFMCDRFPLTTASRRLTWALATAITAALWMFAVDHMVRTFGDASLIVRALLCISLILPLGCLLGFGFPTGMAMARVTGGRHTAWFWGINGAAGVTGSIFAVAISISGGIDKTMLAGAVCYALLVIPALGAVANDGQKRV